MSIRIALAGNPNSGKTTLFNDLTGSSQYVGNWPGVTVEKKEGRLKGRKDATIIDLPGIYSLSPYTLEEVVSRNYLIEEKPDVIINIVDSTNIERNLYLTTQLAETGIPVVVALNMIDVVQKRGDKIDIARLEKELGFKVVEISALKGMGTKKLAEYAIAAAGKASSHSHKFSPEVEAALGAIESIIAPKVSSKRQLRWYAVKLFERDEKIALPVDMDKIEAITAECEKAFDDDSESIITNERYKYISTLLSKGFSKKNKTKTTASDKIDKVVTNRWLALPIFAVVMFLIYYVSVTTIGTVATDWANDGVFGDGWHLLGIGAGEYEEALGEFEEGITAEEPDPSEYGVWVVGIPVLAEAGLDAVNAQEWLKGLILDGIIGGVGAVLGFLPQMLILFFFLALLEDCGYMARIAFIMDRIFRKFGLSGKSFIPMLISTGCGVPGIMASRTIENESDRKMTIMTTTFIPCGAKLPIIALIAGALFPGSVWVAPSAYFIGVAAVICSGIILKKTKSFAGDAAPFVMELPAYHMPGIKGVFIHMWDRGKSFVKKAGTIIFLACGFVWFLSSFGFSGNSFGMIEAENSMLASIGRLIAPIFAPLGFGDWRATVATFTGLIAKENVVGTFGVLYGIEEVADNGMEIWTNLQGSFTMLSAYSFLVFNLLCAPCFAAIGAIRREMGSAKWTWIAVGYQTGLAYAAAFTLYQLGMLFTGNGFGFASLLAFLVVIVFVYLLIRPESKPYQKDVRINA